jgi:hypothetical protein
MAVTQRVSGCYCAPERGGRLWRFRKRKAAVNRLQPEVSRIIPGDWGKARPGWWARPLLKRIARFVSGGRIHQFLWHVRACQSRGLGTRRSGAIRSRSEPSQVAQAGFELERIAVTQRVSGCYCAPERGGRLWRSRKRGLSKKSIERWTKWAPAAGRTRGPGKMRENLPQRRRCYKRRR